MSVLQAALIALLYALAVSSLNAGLGRYVLAQPLIAGTLAGALLGDPLRGAQLGGIANLAALALTPSQLRISPDLALVGYVGVPLLLLAGVRADSPALPALMLGLWVLGIVLSFARRMFNTLASYWADYFADQGDITNVALVGIVVPQIWTVIVSFITALFLLLLDAEALVTLANALPAWLRIAMQLAGHLLAALGIALALRALLQGSSVAYFLLGWLLSPQLGVLAALVFGASLAMIHAYLTRRRVDTANPTLAPDVLPSEIGAEYAAARRLELHHLLKSSLLWLFFHNSGENLERGQNLGFAIAFAPIAHALCQTLEERIAFLRRTLTFFSTEQTLGAAVVGAVAALEERRANGEPISDAELIGAKSGLMLAAQALGTALIRNAALALLIAVGTALASEGSLWGVLLAATAQSVIVIGGVFVAVWLAHRQTARSCEWARQSGWMRPALFGLMRVGAFALGGVLTLVAPLRLPLEAGIQLGEAFWSPQAQVLSALHPGALSLLWVLGLWWLMRYQRASPIILMGLSVAIALVGGALLSNLSSF